MLYAKLSTAVIVTVGPVLDADGVAVTDGVVGDFKASKNGGAPAALNGSATLTHRHTGHYSLSLTATDVNTLGTLEIVIDDTVNACPVKEIMVLPAEVYDAIVSGSGNGVRADLRTWKGSAPDDLIGGHVQADMQAVLDGVLTAAKFADAFITAAKIAADAFTAAKFHADVTTEFQSGLATAAALAVTDGKIDVIDNFLDTEIAAILAAVDTEIAQILTDLAAVGVIVDAIKTKTDALPSDPADASVVAGLIAALEAKIDIVDAIIDSITSRIPPALAAGGQMKARAEVVDDKSDYALSAAGQAAVADKLLGRTRAGGADGGRTVAQCLALGRNRWTVEPTGPGVGTLTVYGDDDSTPLWTAEVTLAAGDPVTGVDPT